MIDLKELLKGKDFASLPKEHQDNLLVLLERINKVRIAYGRSMIITSCIRTKEDQIRIYNQKGITDINRIPMKSKHIICAAVDISDPKRELQVWCQNNQELLRSIGLWLEDFRYTQNWVHFQIMPYGSYKEGGSIFFIP